MLEPEFKEKSIDVHEKYPPGDTIIMADDKRIQQAVLNVLTEWSSYGSWVCGNVGSIMAGTVGWRTGAVIWAIAGFGA